jgi:hypothetical protein
MRAPWRWHTGRTIRHLLNADGINFAQVSMPAEARAESQTYIEAGRLILAAPDLLAALRRMDRMHALMMEKCNHGASWYDAECLREMNEAPLDAARAITRATLG